MAMRKSKKRKATPDRTTRAQPGEKNGWQKLIELGYQIPDEELARLRPDLARNFDHYLHGSPKQD